MLLRLRHDLIAGQARREAALLTDDTTDEAHRILELEVVALYDRQIEALLLAAVGVVGDPLREVRLDEGKVLHRKLGRLDRIVAEVFGTDGGVDSVALLRSIAEVRLTSTLVDAAQQFLSLSSWIALEVEVAVAPVDSEEVVDTELVVDEAYTLVRGLSEVVIGHTVEDRGCKTQLLRELSRAELVRGVGCRSSVVV